MYLNRESCNFKLKTCVSALTPSDERVKMKYTNWLTDDPYCPKIFVEMMEILQVIRDIPIDWLNDWENEWLRDSFNYRLKDGLNNVLIVDWLID